MEYIFVLILLWIIAGVWYLLKSMGDKYSQPTWWENVILAPVFVIAWIIGKIRYLGRKDD